MTEVPTTGDIDIRVVRHWLDERGGFIHSTCSIPMIAGFNDDRGVYLKCMECDDTVVIGISTYHKILEELGM